MLSVGLAEDAVIPYLSQVNCSDSEWGLRIACINSPRSVTISGDKQLINQLQGLLNAQSIFTRKLRVTVAYHSPQMKSAFEEYMQLVGPLDSPMNSIKVPMSSSVTGVPTSREQVTQPSYWAQNMVSPVQFSRAVTTMCEQSAASLTKKLDRSHRFASVVDHLIEIGPHAALQGPIRDILRTVPRGQDISYSSVLYRKQNAMVTTMNVIGDLHSKGCKVDLRKVNEPDRDPKISRSLLVNLPEYPFDHSQKHWFESRLSRNYRFRTHPPHELLGVRSNDWSPFDRRWRNFLRASELSWTEHHKVNGTVLYPGAGMLVMAIEAAKQIADPLNTIESYVLRDVRFENAMDLSMHAGVLETQVSLRPYQSTGFDSASTFDFSIFSVEEPNGEERDWRLNCHGSIEIEYQEAKETWETRKKAERLGKLFSSCRNVIAKCSVPIASQQMYNFLGKSGLDYGPFFQAAQSQRISVENEAAANVSLFDNGNPDMEPHVVHPVSLDAIMHLCFTAFSGGGQKPMATSVPSSLAYMWISDRGLSVKDSESVPAFSKLTYATHRGFCVDTGAVDLGNTGHIKLFIEGLELTNITHTPRADTMAPHPDQSYYNINCKVALNKLDPRETASYLEKLHPTKQDMTEFSPDVRSLLKSSLGDLTQSVGSQRLEDSGAWKQHYYQWAQHHLATTLRDIQNTQSFDELIVNVEKTSHVGRMYAEVARNLVAMFRDEVDPLELLFGGDLARNFYEEISGYKSVCQLAEYVDLLAHEKPGLTILEVGSGTGSGTRNVVRALKTHIGDDTGTLRCKRYDFTDISASFFESAREEFRDISLKVNYRVLDVEKNFAEQGFVDADYDVVIAINVIHATRNLANTLRNLRKAMRPGAKLIVQEPLKPDGGTIGFIFGLLPGWWFGIDEGRQLSPNLSVEQWDGRLKECGFSGTDMVIRDFEELNAHETGVFITTAVEEIVHPVKTKDKRQCAIIMSEEQRPEENLARELDTALFELFGTKPLVLSLEEASRQPHLASYFLVVLDCTYAFLDILTEDSWSHLQALIRIARDLLWVTAAGGKDPNPAYGLLDGFSRVLRSEHYSLHLVTLALDSANSSNRKSGFIMRLAEEMAAASYQENYEQDYVEIDGMLHTKRVVEANYVRSAMEKQLTPYQPKTGQLSDFRDFALNMDRAGELETMHYMQFQRDVELEPDQVEIAVKAVSLDRRDHDAALGHSKNIGFGSYCAGVVSRAGSNVEMAPGTRVFAACDDCFRSHALASAQLLVELPKEMSFTEACESTIPTLGAHFALVVDGRVRLSDSVLVQNGVSPAGQAAIKLCKDLGIKQLWSAVANEEERTYLSSVFDLPDEAILPASSIDREIKECSRKQAVDIVLAADCEWSSPQHLSHIAPHGRLIKLATTSGGSHEEFRAIGVPSNGSVSNIQLRDFVKRRSEAIRESLEYSIRQGISLPCGDLKSQPRFSISRLSEVFDYLRDSQSGERVTVEFDPNAEITVSLRDSECQRC